MMAVCKAQFSAKRYQDGMKGLVALAQSNYCFGQLLQQEMGMDIKEMMRISRYATVVISSAQSHCSTVRVQLVLNGAAT